MSTSKLSKMKQLSSSMATTMSRWLQKKRRKKKPRSSNRIIQCLEECSLWSPRWCCAQTSSFSRSSSAATLIYTSSKWRCTYRLLPSPRWLSSWIGEWSTCCMTAFYPARGSGLHSTYSNLPRFSCSPTFAWWTSRSLSWPRVSAVLPSSLSFWRGSFLEKACHGSGASSSLSPGLEPWSWSSTRL